MAIPSPSRMPLKLTLRDHLRCPEKFLAQRAFVRQQLVAARSRVQSISNDRTGPVLASLCPIAVVERFSHHFMLPENRKSAEAKRIKVQRIWLPAIWAADPLIIRVGDCIRIRVEVEGRQLDPAISATRRAIQGHQALRALRVNPKPSTSLQSAGRIEINRRSIGLGTPWYRLSARPLNGVPAQYAIGQRKFFYPGLGATTLRARHRVHANLMAAIFART